MNVGLYKTKTNDKVVRKKLIQTLLGSADTTGVIEELEIARGKARVDIVRVSKATIHAYEIKSDVDTLTRLPRQARYYNQIFSTVTLVVGANHVIEALYVIPDWWGVIVAEVHDGELCLNEIRHAQSNKSINYDSIYDLMRKHELVQLLDECTTCMSYSGMSKPRLVNEAKRELSTDFFTTQLSKVLLSRGNRTRSSFEVVL